MPPALSSEWPGSFTCYCGNTESWPWRRQFSRRRSCRDSNPRPFNHESGALTPELSLIPCVCVCVCVCVCRVFWTPVTHLFQCVYSHLPKMVSISIFIIKFMTCIYNHLQTLKLQSWLYKNMPYRSRCGLSDKRTTAHHTQTLPFCVAQFPNWFLLSGGV